MLIWQDKYRAQMAEMIQQQKTAAGSMEEAARHFATLLERAEEFRDVAQRLGETLEELKEQREQIHQTIDALGSLLEKTSDALPEVENKVLELTEQMTFGIKSHKDELAKAIQISAQGLVEAIGGVKKQMLEATQANNQEINAHIKQLSERTTEQFQKLDAALQRELTTALSTLGSQLASLSRRFVEDYTPLTDRLRELVRIAAR